jgi:pyruvate,water dikinase
MTAATLPLAELRAADSSAFGGKSSALGELIAAEIPVPPGFAVSTAAYHAFVEAAGLERMIETALSRVSPEDVDSVGAAAHAIAEAMRSAPVPGAIRAEIARRYAELGDEPPVAVRSSALGEDSQEATFAGQQETYLWVRGVDRVSDAVRDCWVSLYSPTAITYRARLGQTAAAMGVAVQLMVDAAVSGVMFTCNPVSGDRSMVAINASWGLGLAVVGGEVTPDDYLVSKVTREVVREHVHTKDVEYAPDAGGLGAIRLSVPEERRDAACLDRPALEALVELGRRVEGYFGSPQDIEWALARGAELPSSLFVLQSRPVTAAPRRERNRAASALSLVMDTFGVGRDP